MILGGIEVNQFSTIRLILELKNLVKIPYNVYYKFPSHISL